MSVLALGASDCEALHDGWLGQPVNALSSLAYVAAGAYVLRLGAPRSRAVAVALAAVGVGSVLYHGPMPAGAEQVHDWSIVALVAAAGMTWARDAFRRPPALAVAAFGAALAVNALTRTGDPLCRPDSLLQGHAAWHALTAVAVAAWFAPWGARPRTAPSAPDVVPAATGGSADPPAPLAPELVDGVVTGGPGDPTPSPVANPEGPGRH